MDSNDGFENWSKLPAYVFLKLIKVTKYNQPNSNAHDKA